MTASLSFLFSKKIARIELAVFPYLKNARKYDVFYIQKGYDKLVKYSIARDMNEKNCCEYSAWSDARGGDAYAERKRRIFADGE